MRSSSSSTTLPLEELGATGGEVFGVSLAATEAFGNAVEHPHEPTARLIEIDGLSSDNTVSITIHDFGHGGMNVDGKRRLRLPDDAQAPSRREAARRGHAEPICPSTRDADDDAGRYLVTARIERASRRVRVAALLLIAGLTAGPARMSTGCWAAPGGSIPRVGAFPAVRELRLNNADEVD